MIVFVLWVVVMDEWGWGCLLGISIGMLVIIIVEVCYLGDSLDIVYF